VGAEGRVRGLLGLPLSGLRTEVPHTLDDRGPGSRIPTLRTFVGTLRTHLPHIQAFIDGPLANAVGEGLNRMIKIVKNRASGYRHLNHFADLIYLTVGDLDIPAQIPSQLRTL
jgi:transposase